MENTNRPTLVTIFCGYYFINWAYAFLNNLVLSIMTRQFTFFSFTSDSYLGVLYILANVVAVIGIWFMRKWGVIFFALVNITYVSYVIWMMRDSLSYFQNMQFVATFALGLVIPVAMIVVGLLSFSEME